MKNTSQKYDINRPRSRHGYKYTKYKMCLSIMMVDVLSNTSAIFKAQFMKELSNTKAELQKALFIKKACISFSIYIK